MNKRTRLHVDRSPDTSFQAGALLASGGTGSFKTQLYRGGYNKLPIDANGRALTAQTINPPAQNRSPLDMAQLYSHEALEIQAEIITGDVINSYSNSALGVAFPIWKTTQLNFEQHHTEWNSVEFSKVAEGSNTYQPTYSAWSFTDRSDKYAQSLTFSRDMIEDPNYGQAHWLGGLKALSDDAKLTLYKQADYGMVAFAYGNEMEIGIGRTPINLSLLFEKEAKAFAIFAKDQHSGWGFVMEIINDSPGLDLVYVPRNTQLYLNLIEGQSKPIEAIRIGTDELTGQPFEEPIEGPRSLKTFMVGDRSIPILELGGYVVNSREKANREDPLETKVTLCEAYPCNANITANHPITSNSPQQNNMRLFYQTPTQGYWQDVSYADMIRSSFLFDKNGNYSEYVIKLEKNKNQKNVIPYSFRNVDNVNDEDTSFGYDLTDLHVLQNKNEPRLMDSFREHFFHLSYIPGYPKGKWRRPVRWGDMNLTASPPEWNLRAARGILRALHKETSLNLLKSITKLDQLVRRINDTPYSAEYVQPLIDTNLPFSMAELAEKEKTVGYNKADFLNLGFIPILPGQKKDLEYEFKNMRFVGNEYGSLRLPRLTNLDQESEFSSKYIYAPGFGHGAGLMTAAKEATKPTTQWGQFGREAKEVVDEFAVIYQFFHKYMPLSDVINPLYRANYIETKNDKDAAVIALMDAVIQPTGPVQIGIPATIVPNVDLTKIRGTDPLKTMLDKLRNQESYFNYIKNEDKFFNAYPSLWARTDLRALVLLNKAAFDQLAFNILDQGPSENLDELLNIILELGARPSMTGTVSTLAVEGYQLLKEKKVDEFKRLIQQMRTQKGIKTLQTKWKDEKKVTMTEENTPENETLVALLKKSQDELNEVGKVTVEVEPRPVTSLKATPTKIFQGDYSADPESYMMAPLVSSPALEEFIIATGNRWIIPMAPRWAVETEKVKVAKPEPTIEKLQASIFSKLAGFGKTMTMDAQPTMVARTMPKKSTRFSMSELLTFGAKPDEEGEVEEEATESLVAGWHNFNDIYFGPWRKQLEFAEDLNADEGFVYRALLQCRCNMKTYLALADIGIPLMNFVMFRPDQEFKVKSLIIVQKGAVRTAISRFQIVTSSEDRGYVTVSVFFYTALPRIRPDMIRGLFNCFPAGFIGGRNTNFLTNPSQLNAPTARKPSIICMPTPISERHYDGVINMANSTAFLRPDSEIRSHLCKYSSAELYMTIFGKPATIVDTKHASRLRYWNTTEMSHVGHIGLRYVYDSDGKHLIKLEGNGPVADECMNTNGAEKTWNGMASSFPNAMRETAIHTRAL